MIGDVLESKRNTMARQDVPDGDAEGGPGKLDEGEHGVYMTDAKRNSKVTRKQRCLRRLPFCRGTESAFAWWGIVCLNEK